MNRAATLLRTAAHYTFPRTSFRLIRSRHVHDEAETEFLSLLADPYKAAIDIGANVGRYAYPLAQIVRHVHAFEPHPRLAHLLRAALPENTTVHNLAVSDQPGEVALHIPVTSGRQDEGRASLLDTQFSGVDVTSVIVEAVTLDSMQLECIGFIKVDVEGHELEVLHGGLATIQRDRPICLVEAEDRHQPGAVSKVAAFFKALSYQGAFVKDRQIFDIGAFRREMQDPAILAEVRPHTPRRLVPYVNNFIFFPDAYRASHVIKGIQQKLAE